MSTVETVMTVISSTVATGLFVWVGKRIVDHIRAGRKAAALARADVRGDVSTLRKDLTEERAARLKASEECDGRVEAVRTEADTRLSNAMARQDSRAEALQARVDAYVEKRVEDQRFTAELFGKHVDRNSKSLDAVAMELKALRALFLGLMEGGKGGPNA